MICWFFNWELLIDPKIQSNRLQNTVDLLILSGVYSKSLIINSAFSFWFVDFWNGRELKSPSYWLQNTVYLLICWAVQMLNCWAVDLLSYWAVELLICWAVDLLSHSLVIFLVVVLDPKFHLWYVELLSCWVVELLSCWAVPLLICWFCK